MFSAEKKPVVMSPEDVAQEVIGEMLDTIFPAEAAARDAIDDVLGNVDKEIGMYNLNYIKYVTSVE